METLKRKLIVLLVGTSFFLSVFFFIDILQKKASKNAITIGSKNCIENQLLSQIMAILIEKNTNIKVIKKFNLEGTIICFEALLSKDIDLYPEYTGSALFAILKEKDVSKRDVFQFLKKKFLKDFNLVWLNPFGFENRYVLCMQKDKANRLNITTISDLKAYLRTHELIIGFDPEFSIREEIKSLQNRYFFSLNHKIIDQSLLYFSLNKNILDVIDGFSTDSKINRYDFLILKDDKKALPSYIAAPLIRQDVLQKYPQITDLLNKLNNKITDQKMKRMIYLAEENSFGIYEVALEFLRSENLIY